LVEADNGVRHLVAGVWDPEFVIPIAGVNVAGIAPDSAFG
jgi:hypothetical protein